MFDHLFNKCLNASKEISDACGDPKVPKTDKLQKPFCPQHNIRPKANMVKNSIPIGDPAQIQSPDNESITTLNSQNPRWDSPCPIRYWPYKSLHQPYMWTNRIKKCLRRLSRLPRPRRTEGKFHTYSNGCQNITSTTYLSSKCLSALNYCRIQWTFNKWSISPP